MFFVVNIPGTSIFSTSFLPWAR